MEARLIQTDPALGAWNMALDESLMDSMAATGGCVLRFYRWSEPTVTLGYFQSFGDGDRHAASRNCPRIRRSTGGGAIVHDRELTYSFITPVSERFGARTLYEAFHETFIETLNEWGIGARFWDQVDAPKSDAYLCFQRRTSMDVVLGTAKLCGSAQRRRSGVVLQHGSVLLGTSSSAPDVVGLDELADVAIEMEDLRDRWSRRVATRLGLTWCPGNITNWEHEMAENWVKDRFNNEIWNRKRP